MREDRMRRALALGEARTDGRVVVAPSFFKGHGVFAHDRGFRRGEAVVLFRGLVDSLAALEAVPDTVRERVYEYSFCDERRDLCVVPLRGRGELRPLPAGLSGALVNEAAVVEGVGDFAANVAVEFDRPSLDEVGRGAENCPYLGGPAVDLVFRASRDIKPWEELLICYGSNYSARGGYRASATCS